jgi:hypothetical protein
MYLDYNLMNLIIKDRGSNYISRIRNQTKDTTMLKLSFAIHTALQGLI